MDYWYLTPLGTYMYDDSHVKNRYTFPIPPYDALVWGDPPNFQINLPPLKTRMTGLSHDETSLSFLLA